MKLIEKTREKHSDIVIIGKNFLQKSPKAQETKAKIDKWCFIELKMFIHQRKNQQNEETNDFANYSYGKRLISRIYKEPKYSTKTQIIK
jgi:hypothetical protein